MAHPAPTLKDRFLNDGAKIAYREMSERGGSVIAWFKNDHWCFRHETDAKSSFEPMSIYRAAALFPTDAREWAA